MPGDHQQSDYRQRKKARLVAALGAIPLLLLAGCANRSYYAYSEDALDTQGYFHLLDHIASYYPSGVSLNFPGYIVGFEETSRTLVARDRDDILVDESVYADAGFTTRQLVKTLRYTVPFISQIMRYEGRPYGEGNCALYNLYRSAGRGLVEYCADSPQNGSPAPDYEHAFEASWQAVDTLKRRLARDVASRRYTHLVVASMGLDTPQEEAIRNYTSIVSSIRRSAGPAFEPLFVGVTWPSFYANRWFDPLWEALAYSPVADRADVIGLSWLGVLFDEAILPLGDRIDITVIGHSFGARTASMALCVGPAIRRQDGDRRRQPSAGKVQNFIGLAPAFSLRRFVDRDYLFYENVYYPDFCPAVDRVAFTAASTDSAFSAVFWSDAAGDHNFRRRFCRRQQPVSFACVSASEEGVIDGYDPRVKLNYIDTSALMRYTMPGTKSPHSDIFRTETGRLLWQIIDAGTAEAGAAPAGER